MHPVGFSSIRWTPLIEQQFSNELQSKESRRPGCLQVFKRSLGHTKILSSVFLASWKQINHKSKSIKIHWWAVGRQKIAVNSPHCFPEKCTPYVTSGDKQEECIWFNVPHKNSIIRSFWTMKTPKQKELYELYVIHKFGAKKNCTSEDTLVLVVMNLKTKRLTW